VGLAEPLQWKWKSGKIAVSAEQLSELHDRFLIELDEAALEADPGDILALSRLGESYTRAGRYEDGLRIDQQLVALLPEDETARYNLACSLALTDQPDEALEELERAIDCGYRDAAHLQADEDLESLHDDPRFDALIARLRAL
jgi:tetratricopeptide (TPR) repeat protein